MIPSTMLGTLYSPSTNPIGEPSIVAFALCIVAIVLTEASSGTMAKWRQLGTILIPTLLFLALIHGDALVGELRFTWQYRSFPSADDYMANYIYLACGFVVSVRGLKLENKLFRLAASIELLMFAWLILTEAQRLSDYAANQEMLDRWRPWL